MTAGTAPPIIRQMKRFVPLTRKINLIIVSSLVVGVGVVIAYFAFTQNLSLRETSQANLRQQSDILFQSIKNAMLPGEAPIAVQLFEDIRLANPNYKIFLLRENGVQAFSDNSTIETVNGILGFRGFEPKEVFPRNVMIMEEDLTRAREQGDGSNIHTYFYLLPKIFAPEGESPQQPMPALKEWKE